MAETTGPQQRKRGGPGRPFRPGQSGNPAGRPRGARHAATLMAEALIDGEAEEVVRAMVEAAKAGDTTAGRAILDRLVPPRRERPVMFEMPELCGPADAVAAMAAITAAVASGDLTPGEAGELAKLVGGFVQAIEATEFEARIAALEQRQGGR
jgi:hypothetical protein